MTWLARRASPWKVPLLYGLATLCLLVVASAGLHVLFTNTPKRTEPITLTNVEAYMRQWLETFNYSVRKLPDNPDAHFAYSITNTHGRKSLIRRLRSLEHYLMIHATVTVSDEHRKRFTKWPQGEAVLFTGTLVMDLTRYRITFANIKWPLEDIVLEKKVPITYGLTESHFMQSLEDIDAAEVFAEQRLAEFLRTRAECSPHRPAGTRSVASTEAKPNGAPGDEPVEEHLRGGALTSHQEMSKSARTP